MASVRRAIDSVRDALDAACREMPPAEYKQVLEELVTDFEGHLDALKDENPELFAER
jgi:hypothetical protein